MPTFEIGEKVIVSGNNGFCTSGTAEVTEIKQKFDEDTGEPYDVVVCDGRLEYRADNGNPVTPPWAYRMDKIGGEDGSKGS